MKRTILLCAILACITLSIGCQSSGVGGSDPTTQLTVAEDVYATTETLLTDAKNAGLIPDAVAPQIVAARNTARAALQAAQQNVASNASQFQAAINQFNAVLPQLIAWRNLYATKPTTKPVSLAPTRNVFAVLAKGKIKCPSPLLSPCCRNFSRKFRTSPTLQPTSLA